jgi:hypothetical protein
MNSIEKRYKVYESHMTGELMIHEQTGERRASTIRLVCTGLLWHCRTIISTTEWDHEARTPEEAQRSFINQCYSRLESYQRRIDDERKAVEKAGRMSLELAPNKRRTS